MGLLQLLGLAPQALQGLAELLLTQEEEEKEKQEMEVEV